MAISDKPQSPTLSTGDDPVEVRVERLRAQFELEKQRIANRGQWLGAGIGAAGMIVIAVIGLAFRPASSDSTPPSKQLIELESRNTELTKQSAELSQRLGSGLALEQDLRRQVSELNKQLGDNSATQAKLRSQITKLEGESKSSPQTLMAVYPFTWPGTIEDCRERAVHAIADLKFQRLNTTGPEVMAGNGEDVVLVFCSVKLVVMAGPESDYITKSLLWLQSRMQAK